MQSQAITWDQFWRPFNNGYGYGYYPLIRSGTCRKEIFHEEFFPGNSTTPGYTRRWSEVRQVPCY